MTESPGRRERKKAATRQTIADTALRLFRERGYEAVGIRDVAAEADVAVTTLFAHFASKEALVFFHDHDFEQQLAQSVISRPPRDPLIGALHDQIELQVRHCTTGDARGLWRMIDASPALREYDNAMRLRHAETLAVAIATDLGLEKPSTACQTIARFTLDAFSIARKATDPQTALQETFEMIEAAWGAAELNPD